MKIRFWLAGIVLAGCAVAADSSSAAPVTFNRDILPILEKNVRVVISLGRLPRFRC